MTPIQEAMKKAHGTPAQFGAAVNLACDQLFLTTAEAAAAVAKYQQEWDTAGRLPDNS